MCTILSAAYLGLARYFWELIKPSGHYGLLINVEGFFITTGLLALLLGWRPYLSPCSLQVGSKGLKYRGPYWPTRKTVNWDQVFRLYVSPELIIVLYHIKPSSKMIWPMFIQSVYFADKDKVTQVVMDRSPVPVTKLANPNWKSRLIVIVLFVAVVIWVLEVLVGAFSF